MQEEKGLSSMKLRSIRQAIIVSCAAACALFAFTAGGCVFERRESGENGSLAAGTPHPSAAGIPDRTTPDGDKIVNFAKGRTEGFYAADGYGNGGVFGCVWSGGNAQVKNGLMNMSLTAADNGYYGAEYRSATEYSYGYYSVSMKAARCSGVISSFFTYTNRPWDEIDIEFLGNDTGKIQLNYYTGGVGGHEFLYELGFDGAEGFHEYGFDWQRGSITWYVDGKAVYRATENIPTAAGKIMMNVWNVVGADEWAGAFDSSALPVTAQYGWIGYSAN